MEGVNVGQVIVYIVIPLLAWLFKREVHAAEEKAKEAKELAVSALDKLNLHKLHVAEQYVHAERFTAFESAIFRKLDTIEAKLDGKQDKAGHRD